MHDSHDDAPQPPLQRTAIAAVHSDARTSNAPHRSALLSPLVRSAAACSSTASCTGAIDGREPDKAFPTMEAPRDQLAMELRAGARGVCTQPSAHSGAQGSHSVPQPSAAVWRLFFVLLPLTRAAWSADEPPLDAVAHSSALLRLQTQLLARATFLSLVMSKRTAVSAVSASSSTLADGADNPLKWAQARQRDVDWRKSDLLDVIYTLRQILGIVCGIIWGIAGLTGMPAILLFVGINVAVLLSVDARADSSGRTLRGPALVCLVSHSVCAMCCCCARSVYYTKYLGVDDEDEAYGRMDLLTEGLWTSFAMFILTWICVYSIPL